jgi:dihydroflavonol-4-reductase
MRVLVTGGTGFVGASLVAALVRRGDQVRVLRRASSSLKALEGLEVEHVLGDILEPEAVARAVAGCDLVFHVAAISSYWRSQRDQIYKVNVEGTRIVMEACLRAGVPRVVHTSSIAAIGIPPAGTLGTEETPFDALSRTFPYFDSKRLAEEEVRKAVARGLEAVIVNPGTVIGAGDHYMVSGSIVVEMARGRMPAVPPGGMPVVDIDAVVQGHLAAAARGRVGERYVLNGENLSHHALASIVGGVIGKRPPRLVLPRWMLPPLAAVIDLFNRISPRPPLISGDQIRVGGANIFFDPAKAVRELDMPLLPIRAAVEKAHRWYRDHGYI